MRLVFPICNRKPECAPNIMGHTFLLCWRCSMVIVGIIVTLIAIQLKQTFILQKNIIWGITLMFPMIIDGNLQYLKGIPSTNLRRAMTGFLFGVGVTIIINVIMPK